VLATLALFLLPLCCCGPTIPFRLTYAHARLTTDHGRLAAACAQVHREHRPARMVTFSRHAGDVPPALREWNPASVYVLPDRVVVWLEHSISNDYGVLWYADGAPRKGDEVAPGLVWHFAE
jgi:hypothetical protein